MTWDRVTAAGLVAGALLMVGCASGGGSPGAMSGPMASERMVGSWVIDGEASDDPREVMAEAREAARAAGPAGGGRRAGAGRRGAGGRPARGAPDGRGEDSPMAQFTEAAARFDLEVTDTLVTIRMGGGRLVRLVPDGEERPQGESRARMTIKTRWDDGALVVERRQGEGFKGRDRYTLSADGTRLTVERRIEARVFPQAVVVRLVYDRRSG